MPAAAGTMPHVATVRRAGGTFALCLCNYGRDVLPCRRASVPNLCQGGLYRVQVEFVPYVHPCVALCARILARCEAEQMRQALVAVRVEHRSTRAIGLSSG